MSQDNLRTYLQLCSERIFRESSLCVVHTCWTHDLPDVSQPRLRKVLYAQHSSQDADPYHSPLQKDVLEGCSLIIHCTPIKICLAALSIKILGETLQLKPTLPIKYFNLYLKQNTTCKPCEIRQEAVPAKGIIYLHQV